MSSLAGRRRRSTPSGMPDCLPSFTHINRYWDKTHRCHAAKILPGEFYVTSNQEAICTTLGSCVSACIWDERSGIGGMNHFMLPLTNEAATEVNWGQKNVAGNATRYGNYAMEHMINEILSNGGRRKHLQAKVFGGGKVLKNMGNVGKKNADFVLEYLSIEKIALISQDLCDEYARKVFFNPLSGRAKVKRLRTFPNDTVSQRETKYLNDIVHEPVDGAVELF